MNKEVLDKIMPEVLRRFADIKIDHSHHVPYLGGTSNTRDVVYIDKRIPKTISFNSQEYNLIEYLTIHELVEKTLMDTMNYDYNTAHKFAEETEDEYLRNQNMDYKPYHAYIFSAYHKTLKSFNPLEVPLDLDLNPYKADGLKSVVHKIRLGRILQLSHSEK